MLVGQFLKRKFRFITHAMREVWYTILSEYFLIQAFRTIFDKEISIHCIGNISKLDVMCTTRGERRLMNIGYQKEYVESRLVITCRMMHNWIEIYHCVQAMRIFTY